MKGTLKETAVLCDDVPPMCIPCCKSAINPAQAAYFAGTAGIGSVQSPAPAHAEIIEKRNLDAATSAR